MPNIKYLADLRQGNPAMTAHQVNGNSPGQVFAPPDRPEKPTAADFEISHDLVDNLLRRVGQETGLRNLLPELEFLKPFLDLLLEGITTEYGWQLLQ